MKYYEKKFADYLIPEILIEKTFFVLT